MTSKISLDFDTSNECITDKDLEALRDIIIDPDLEVSDGKTAEYYDMPPTQPKILQDLISYKDMNAQIGTIFSSCYRYGQVSHSGMMREINKIIFYAEAEKKRLLALVDSIKVGVNFDTWDTSKIKCPKDKTIKNINLEGWDTSAAGLIHMTMGISGEAGELLDAVKKTVIYKKPLDRENIIEELGDIEFYLEGFRQELGISRDLIIEANYVKLIRRYKGAKYSNEQAIARADK